MFDHPETLLHSNQIKSYVRSQIIRRKILFGTRSEAGRAARDGCLWALKTCNKLRLSFWDNLRNRLGVAGSPEVPRLTDLIGQRAAT